MEDMDLLLIKDKARGIRAIVPYDARAYPRSVKEQVMDEQCDQEHLLVTAEEHIQSHRKCLSVLIAAPSEPLLAKSK